MPDLYTRFLLWCWCDFSLAEEPEQWYWSKQVDSANMWPKWSVQAKRTCQHAESWYQDLDRQNFFFQTAFDQFKLLILRHLKSEFGLPLFCFFLKSDRNSGFESTRVFPRRPTEEWRKTKQVQHRGISLAECVLKPAMKHIAGRLRHIRVREVYIISANEQDYRNASSDKLQCEDWGAFYSELQITSRENNYLSTEVEYNLKMKLLNYSTLQKLINEVLMHSIIHRCNIDFYLTNMDLIQYFSLTLNSGVNSVMEGYGSVCKRVILAPLFLFLTFKETESTEKEEKLNCDCHESLHHRPSAKFN